MKWEYATVHWRATAEVNSASAKYEWHYRMWISLPGADGDDAEQIDTSKDETGTHRPTVLSVLNSLGEHGWELVDVTVLGSNVVVPSAGIRQTSDPKDVGYILKRPRG